MTSSASKNLDREPRSTNLDAYITSSRPQEPLATSQEIRDRGSTFVANLYPATSLREVHARINYLKNVIHGAKPATHEIAAWRCMVLKHGRSGLGGPDDFELTVGSMDDREQWAGGKVLKVMQTYAIIDAVVIVSRWYGGTMLGPARFSHIETCTTEVCQQFRRAEELRECVSTLKILDAVLAGLRAEYSGTSGTDQSTTAGSSSVSKDYSTIDVEKGKRLVKARENAIKSVKSLLAKRLEGPEHDGA
ncbi:ribosomal protein S5 domain 2-type protein [Lyophyllum atratum]|nr:ribosomal protein S5 domain 2-type protein [Lyophyllum atratum]